MSEHRSRSAAAFIRRDVWFWCGRFHGGFDGPEQEALGFLAVVLKGGSGVREAREPRPDRIEIVVRGDLCATRDGAVETLAAVQFGRNNEPLRRRRMKREERRRG